MKEDDCMAEKHNIGRNSRLNPDSISGQLDRERNRSNYRYRVKINEAKVQKLREYAYRLVQKWTREEKIVLIQSYGDISQLGDRNNDEEVNRQLVETLLLNLTESQLNQIVQEVNQSSNEMLQQIKQVNREHMDQARKGLSDAKKNSYSRNTTESQGRYRMRTNSQLVNLADSINDTGKFHVDYKIIRRMNSGLLKEVNAVLDTMNNVQLASTARDCGIDITNLSKIKDIRDSIIEAVAKYVLIVTGQQKDGTIGNLTADGAEGVEYILSKTSWAWVIGETPLTPKELVDIRKRAKDAKQRFEERLKSIGRKNNRAAKTKSKEFQSLTGIKTKNAKEAASLLEQHDTGFMHDWTFEQVVLKASELGIDYNPRKTTLGELKLLIYGKVASDIRDANKRLKKLDSGKNKFISKSTKRGATIDINTRQQIAEIDRTKSILSEDGRNKNFGLLSATELSSMTKAPLDTGTGSGGGSIIEFDKDGKIKNAVVNYAQAVWIVGQGDPAYVKKQATENATYEPTELESLTKSAIELIKAGYLDPSDLSLSPAKLRKKIAKMSKRARNTPASNSSDKPKVKRGEKTQVSDKVRNIALLDNKYQDAIRGIKDMFSSADDGAKMEEYMKDMTSAYSYLKSGIINNEINDEEGTSIKELIEKVFSTHSTSGIVEFKKDEFSSYKSEKSAEIPKDSYVRVKFNGDVGDISSDTLFAATPVYVLNKELRVSGSGSSSGGSISGPISVDTITGHRGYITEHLHTDDVDDKFNNRNRTYNKLKRVNDISNNRKTQYGRTQLEKELGIVKHKAGKGASMLYKLMNTGARNILKSNVTLNDSSVMPVYLTNGFTEYLTNAVDRGFDDVTSASSNIYSYLSTSMPVLFGGLQQAGLSFNLATVAAGATMALNAVVDAAGAVFDKILAGKEEDNKIVKYATGGYGGVSQFIAGDSKNGKPNEELVSIDWDNKRYAVKPSGNAEGTHMNSEERSRSFGIAFNEAKIKYDRKLDGSTEDDVALKVYPVTPGISDKINVNGSEVSVIELMMGMYQSVYNIESLMGTNVEINRMIAANTISSGSSGGSAEIPDSDESFPTNLDSITRGD